MRSGCGNINLKIHSAGIASPDCSSLDLPFSGCDSVMAQPELPSLNHFYDYGASPPDVRAHVVALAAMHSGVTCCAQRDQILL